MLKLNHNSILINDKDNVAVAIKDLSKGCMGIAKGHEIDYKVDLKQKVPFGHKFAVSDIGIGQYIIKYGEIIGEASQSIKTGEHVHLHNVEGTRGRGDK